MCGIVGLLHHNADRPDPALLDRMLCQVSHRGPDAKGLYLAGPVGLGHARLSIIDLEHGRQPMQTSDGRFTVVFNGERTEHNPAGEPGFPSLTVDKGRWASPRWRTRLSSKRYCG